MWLPFNKNVTISICVKTEIQNWTLPYRIYKHVLTMARKIITSLQHILLRQKQFFNSYKPGKL